METVFGWKFLKEKIGNAFTGQYPSTLRIKNDQEQRTFAECAQWRFIDEFLYSSTDATALNGTEAIPYANQIIYKVVLANDMNLTGRNMQLYAGGRRYQPYLSDGTETVTAGTTGFVDFTAKLYNMNQNLPTELTELPDSGITVSRAVDGTTFVAGSAQYPLGSDAQVVVTGGVIKDGAPSGLSASGTKIGLAAGTYYFVFTDYGSTTTNVDGFFQIEFEAV